MTRLITWALSATVSEMRLVDQASEHAPPEGIGAQHVLV
jgi:hypothetical protein